MWKLKTSKRNTNFFSIQFIHNVFKSVRVSNRLYVTIKKEHQINKLWQFIANNLPLNFVAIGPSPDSWMRIEAEVGLVTSIPMKFGGSGGLVCSHPNSIRRNPLMRLSHIPICLSVSVPVHPDTDGPAYAVPTTLRKKHKLFTRQENLCAKNNFEIVFFLFSRITQIHIIFLPLFSFS